MVCCLCVCRFVVVVVVCVLRLRCLLGCVVALHEGAAFVVLIVNGCYCEAVFCVVLSLLLWAMFVVDWLPVVFGCWLDCCVWVC